MQTINQVHQQANRSAAKAEPRSKPTIVKPTIGQFLAVAQQLVPGFKVDDDNEELLCLLYAYAVRDSYFTEQGYHLDKGILLYGNVGTGKTALMKILQRVLNLMHSPFAFALTSVTAAADKFGTTGFEAFQHYRNRHWLFDELGRTDRETVQWFGNKVNVAENLIQNRCELFQQGHISHFTTNLSPRVMEAHYDARAFSRLKEMCNFIKATAEDRRPNSIPKTARQPDEAKVIPLYSDAMKRATILSEVEKLKQGHTYHFLDAGGLHYQYLQERGVITTGAYADVEAEELVRMVANARVTDLDSNSRRELKAFEAAEELPPGNKYTKELRYRCEKRLLSECLEKLASGELDINLLKG